MAISTDYPRPITVNGFVCRNCDDVSDAKKFIDPSKPKTGPDAVATASNAQQAVSFGGSLTSRIAPPNGLTPPETSPFGQRYDKVA